MFNEANSVEKLVLVALAGEGGSDKGLGWTYVPAAQLPRALTDALVEPHLREALIRLNPEIAAQPDRADEVIYRLRAILLAVRNDGLVRCNEEFSAWLRGEKTMPFGPNHEHTPVRLIDFDDLSRNRFVVTNRYTYQSGPECRLDVVLLVNGIPLVVGEAKTPVRPSVTWVDGATDVHDTYELNHPALFVPTLLSFATEGKEFHYGSVRMPLENWAPWRDKNGQDLPGLSQVQSAVTGLLRPEVLLDMLRYFALFATDRKHRRIKVLCRYQQYHGANQIVERVAAGKIKRGLIWHFQGSGKSLLMVFAAHKLRLHPDLHNPTVLIVVDRVDLDTQITATFNATEIPNTVTAGSREELRTLLNQDVRKVIITTVHKFGEAAGVLNGRSNIIVLVDEAHRTQEGDLGRKMREALPNAFLFGLTGTPINRRDRNTFYAFGAEEDENFYMSLYSFQHSIRDKATLPLHFEARLPELRIDRDAIEEAYRNITGHLSEADQNELSKRAARMAVLVKAPSRVQKLVEDIVAHYQEKVEPNGFKAQVVVFDRETCVLFKDEFDKVLPPEASDVVMSVSSDEVEWNRRFGRSPEEEEKLLDRFRDPAEPLKILIVTSRLLTGFDAPILQAMYLDKPMKDHNLLQGICRTNRPYKGKTHGLIVDYIGVFDDVARALDFDEKSVRKVITNLDELKDQFQPAVDACLAFFPGVDRTVAGYEGLIAAQDCIPDNEKRDAFAAAYSVLSQLWEALSPDPMLKPHEADYRWLTAVYESVRPPSGQGKLLWHALGAKTIELIHQNVHVDAVRDDLETLVMDPAVLDEIASSGDPKKKAKEIVIRISARLRRHDGNPKFVALAERLEKLRERFEQGLINSVEFLKNLLQLAKETLEAEQEVDPEDEQSKAKAALTELFLEVKTDKTPVIVERIVADIDEVVRVVRFPSWQQTVAGEREVQKALRGVLLKYKLHKDQDLFDRAYAYIKQYY
jgi:type I restriction enzyme R subunit